MFPTIAGIPCVFPDSKWWLDDWRFRVAAFAREQSATRSALLAQRAGSRLEPPARERLSRLHDALAKHIEIVAQFMRAAGIEPASQAPADPRNPAGVPRNPAEARLDAYLHQIHRDWGWGAASTEVADAVAELEAVLGDRLRPGGLGTMLVLGAGACRLAFELHRRGAEHTVAIDVDPLAFAIAKALIVDGRSLSLFEFTAGPRDGASVAIERALEPPTDRAAAERFHLLFADGLDPPVVDGAFDTVLTPWFIDQVPTDLATFLPVLHRVLSPGGTWVNHGPLLYNPHHTMAAHRYPLEEVLDLVRAAGFEVGPHRYERLTYLQSPDGTQGRTETVLTFAATKVAQPRTSASPDATPAWLDDADLPVAPWPGLAGYRPPHPMFAAIIALVDGTRSLRAIADIMIAKYGLPPVAALDGVRTCLADVYRGSGQAS